MKKRLLVLLALVSTGLVLAGAPSPAQSAVPGIKQTVAFKRLKNYVNFLQSKRTVPASSTRRQTYRSTLTNRRNATNKKVQALYSRTLLRISRLDDKQQRRNIKRIRQNQKAQVQNLNQDLNDRINEIKADQNEAVQRVYDKYAPQINFKSNKRDRLKRQLSRTTNPTKRAKLTRQINKLQTQINGLVSDRTTDVNKVVSRFAGRITSVTNLYQQRINNVKANAQRQIQQQRTAWRQTFRTQVQAAKTRRDAQKDMVVAQAQRGFGYIQQMPPVNE
jgi:hypothetical protein